ncbi:hypothetical protein Micbo1qcDRAFT_202156 [Microdochium bolleyi]|uniref:Myb-like domain-containing protein n=1 Tax=Microdochium bolleyi TaxID=196109 RepID=A0A136JAY9_9PEZI|nr:hypothetical protein Micbo1qcDRAFT_202156 [Microdochium bolleyi]
MELPQYINPYGPDYQGDSGSFFQYELTPGSDSSVSGATDLSSLDTLPSMPHSPFTPAALSEADSLSFQQQATSISEELPGLSPSPKAIGLGIVKRERESTFAAGGTQTQQHHQLPYYNAPWDTHHSQEMMFVDGTLRVTDTLPPVQDTIKVEMSNQGQAALLQDAPMIMPSAQSTLGIQQHATYAPMGAMHGALPQWSTMAAGPQTMVPQQQMWPTTSCSNMPMILRPDQQNSLAYMIPTQDGLPGPAYQPNLSLSGLYQYSQRPDQGDFGGQSVYPSPPSFDTSLDMAGSRLVYDSPRSVKREHRDALSRHTRHRSSSLRRARSSTPDRKFHLIRTPSRGYSRRYHSEMCSPELSSSAEDSDMDDECAAVVVGGVERSARDKYLLKQRRKGWTYKEIREKGNFPEAESTLRGRYRTLTKEKDARVRKPEWQGNDIKLLKRAVLKLGKSDSNGDVKKISWKQVAEYISHNGGSYSFGYATCRKRWDELVAQKAGGNESSD